MKARFLFPVLLFLLLFAHGAARAAYSCSVSSPGFNRAYDSNLATTSTSQTSFTITCTRGSGDASTLNYSVSANNGVNALGINNRAALGGSYLRYDVYMDSACGTQWKGNNNFSGTLQFGSSLSASVTTAYWGCITAGQTGPAGIYSDTVAMTLSYGNSNPLQSTSNTFPVNIATPWTCSISSAPGTVAFAYVAFGGAATASTSFGVTCTTYLPYTLSLDATTGTIVGLTYTLAVNPPSGVGTGSAQTLQIDGTMAAGQAGTCGTATCSGVNSRTLTLSY